MDPLSVIASCLAIAGATTATLKTIRVVQGAGDELKLLMSEVDGLQAVLGTLRAVLVKRRHDPSLPQDIIDEVCDYVASAGETLKSLDTLVKTKLVKGQKRNGQNKIAYTAWIKERDDVRKLQQDLRERRTILPVLLSASNLSDFTHVYTRLAQVANFQTTQSQGLDKLTQEIMQLRRLSDASTASGASNSSESSNDLSLTLATPVESNGESEVHEQDFRVARYMENYNTPAYAAEYRLQSYALRRKRAPAFREKRCEAEWCNCICHRVGSIQTPKFICSLFGALSLKYSGVSVWNHKCITQCHSQSIPTLRASYVFPPWLLERAVHFVLSVTRTGGIQIGLATPRTVPGDSPIFQCAIEGDLMGMQRLFGDGLASPFDVAQSTGRTVLHHAVTYNHTELSQFLIDTGAQPHWEDKDKESTVALAYTRMFGGLVSPLSVQTWQSMFDAEDFLESRRFPTLSKIVLQLTGKEGKLQQLLRNQLELSTCSINDTDAEGRTALSWAASRGDLESVKILLEFDADPNISSHRRQSPLHFPPQNEFANSGEIMTELLKKNADVNCVDFHKRTPLIYGACNQRNIANLKPLFDFRADCNAQDMHERTPLSYATRMKRIETLKFLLDNGCDPSIPDNWGILPLMEAVQQNWHEGLKILLEYPAATSTERTKMQTSLLEEIALRADGETLEIFTKHCTVHGPLSALEDGAWLRNLFEARGNLDDDVRHSYEKLLILQRAGGPGIPERYRNEDNDSSEDSDDADEFFDADEGS
nr:hypothetical protein LTR18_002692 [Exophiala xenobiotica]